MGAFLDGFVLASMLLERSSASALDCVREPLRQAASERLDALERTERNERARAIAELMQRIEPDVAADARLPPRVHALLAPVAPLAVRRDWQGRATAPRRGFRMTSSLRNTLRRFAISPRDPELDRLRGAELIAGTRTPSALEQQLLAEAERAPALDRAAALGALLRGAYDGDTSDPWARAGRELADARCLE